jgi:hypothetical protein
MTPQTQFLVQLYTTPLARADAVVVLCGEDATPRMEVGLQLFRQGAAPTLLLSGGHHEPPRWLGAEHLADECIGKGLAPSRIVVEPTSQNTREQAEAVMAIAKEREWRSLLLVASSYHLPRAFLTFAAVESCRVRLVPVAAASREATWTTRPPGCDGTRAELFLVEHTKIQQYQATGHCASYEQGLACLTAWETTA